MAPVTNTGTGELGVDSRRLQEALQEVRTLYKDALSFENSYLKTQLPLQESHRQSARNLLHYLALRRHDLRPLQEKLASLGLSSLGRSESCVLVNLRAVLHILHSLGEHSWDLPEPEAVDYHEGKCLLSRNTDALLGPITDERRVRIMVTMPSEAGQDCTLVRKLLASGMDCMRINCAHDNAAAWADMIANLRRAETDVGKDCRVLMDLGGPKLRTGPLPPGPRVRKWRPKRDELGRVTVPARIWLTPLDHPQPAPSPADAVLPVPERWLAKLRAGDWITLKDARAAKRRLRIDDEVQGNRWAECWQTAYAQTGNKLRNRSGTCTLGPLPPLPRRLLLRRGDILALTADSDAPQGDLPSIPCSLPEVFQDLRPGERVWFDDGKIGGFIKTVEARRVLVEIDHAASEGGRLGADKGINLPDSNLRLPALTAKDREDLAFIVKHADLVGYSFVRRPSDIGELQEHLARLNGERI